MNYLLDCKQKKVIWEMRELIRADIRKPGRYIGLRVPRGEPQPDWEDVDLKFLLVYPDGYEVGSSHYGSRVIRGLIRSAKWALCDILFTPYPDAERYLKGNNLSLKSLLYNRPLFQFDVIGFSMPHSLLITNVLTILDLGGIPLRASERLKSDAPIIMLGGATTLNPLPYLDFFDVIYVGEAEAYLIEVLKILRDFAKTRTPEIKLKTLEKLVDIPAVLVPPLLNEIPHKAERVWTVQALEIASKVKTDNIPIIEPIQDRAIVEVMRGCGRGCRFCRADIFYRPRRERDIQSVVVDIQRTLENTGHSSLTLLSLSTGDWSGLEKLLRTVHTELREEGIELSMPSLYGKGILKLLPIWYDLHTGSITLAPETGRDELRKVLNKKLRNSELIETVREALGLGFTGIKLYFMIGLPLETDDDIKAIAELSAQFADLALKLAKRKRITVSVSNFIPQPFTPFQWAEMAPPSVLKSKFQLLRYQISKLPLNLKRIIELRWHNPFNSMLCGILDRGDEALSSVILTAWLRGARFDAWDEYFNYEIWCDSFKLVGISPSWYLRERHLSESLPWENLIDPGISREYLVSEYKLALMGVETPASSPLNCRHCGVCNSRELSQLIENQKPVILASRTETNIVSTVSFSKSGTHTSKHRYRLAYRTNGIICALSGRELERLLRLGLVGAMRKLRLNLVHSSGYKKRPKITSITLPSFYRIERAYLEFYSSHEIEEPRELLLELRRRLPEGLEPVELQKVDLSEPPLQKLVSYLYKAFGPDELLIELKEKLEQQSLSLDISDISLKDNVLTVLSRSALRLERYVNAQVILVKQFSENSVSSAILGETRGLAISVTLML